VAGLGTLGGRVAIGLATLGVPLLLLDHGTVEPVNVGLQPYDQRDVGLPKTEALRRRLRAIRPALRVACRRADVRRIGPRVLQSCRLVVLALDSFLDRLALTRVTIGLGVPDLDVALDGSGRSLYGRVSGHNAASGGSCTTCGWDDETWTAVSREAGGSGCAALAAARPEAPATLALPGLADVVAGIATVQAVRLLLGRETDRVIDRECRIDLSSGRYAESRLARDPRCRSSHGRWTTRRLDVGPAGTTVAALFERAEELLGAPVSLAAHDEPLALESACPACARSVATAALRDALPPCPTCGGRLVPLVSGLRSWFARGDAAPVLDRTWAELGLPPGGAVAAANDRGDAVVFLLAADPHPDERPGDDPQGIDKAPVPFG
jgi:hypothetical protein